eukprot:7046345-Pyramimonas_sp.AAC.1
MVVEKSLCKVGDYIAKGVIMTVDGPQKCQLAHCHYDRKFAEKWLEKMAAKSVEGKETIDQIIALKAALPRTQAATKRPAGAAMKRPAAADGDPEGKKGDEEEEEDEGENDEGTNYDSC